MKTLLPSLDELRDQYQIPPVNTGKRFNILGPYGIVTDDREGLHALLDQEGQVFFRSGTEFSLWVFRGQSEIHSPCVPTIARCDDRAWQLLQWCQNIAFVDALLLHPYLQHCARMTWNCAPLRIHPQSIAQHYGLATNLLDTTNSFDVAAFFASCVRDADGQWRPVDDTDEPGVIYAFPPILFHHEADGNGRHFDVGWQPLQRPEQQRASAVLLFKGEDFSTLPSIAAWTLRHDREIAERLLEQFDGGAVLFPPDPAALMAERATQLTAFTIKQIEQAVKAHEAWHGENLVPEMRDELIDTAGIDLVEMAALSWDEFNLETRTEALHQRLENELSKVRFRLTCDHMVVE